MVPVALAIGLTIGITFPESPTVPLSVHETRPDLKYVQKFNGEFVVRIVRGSSSLAMREALRRIGAADVVLEDRDAGATTLVALPADRILAAGVALDAFARDAFYRYNDRDMADYDVEMFDKGGDIWVMFWPVHPQMMVAGCPRTGPALAGYVVDPQTLAVHRFHSAC